ncbi:MAG: nucleotidyltransferase domain-containing protein [Candidatus Thermoplasmatota archaeon]
MPKRKNKTDLIVLKIVERIKVKYKPQKIVLFGSYARGTATEDSDIDLLIVKETKKPFHKRWAEVCRAVSELRKGVGFSPFVITPDELKKRLSIGDPFLEEIMNEGKVLYAA